MQGAAPLDASGRFARSILDPYACVPERMDDPIIRLYHPQASFVDGRYAIPPVRVAGA
jgi:hypothetical protein